MYNNMSLPINILSFEQTKTNKKLLKNLTF